ncbi:nicotinate-nucleotide adenylyltransferase [Facklamia miroungae]|uniref:Probable nicotinate-nucleotide adenylyltransferase n=1 Tax=Facklamia miroungae TaxID=120956 RepID=A0A1G7UIM5_9LACT|nr:nicotinate-nucleotide adenylyltransferase [Facklamia miroungae]NKZ30089.1 nicotinate-nucleotide adenylyltransferase [Facklamia miroungae]SDG47337.1 nicotinate-nucleotide adenylyltransferase [Facklamia miroungae]
MRTIISEQTILTLERECAFATLGQIEVLSSDHDRQRIGILGGTFNPPHLGHLLMAEQVGRQLDLDEVWFMPTAKPPHAPGKQTIASQHRIQMVQRAIEGNPLFKLQAYEVNRGGKNYTVDTMKHFIKKYPESDFYFIIGSDSANDLDTWRDISELASIVQFVGVRRPNEEVYGGSYPIIWVDSPLVELSSTEIRLRVYLEQSIRYQVPETVMEYIHQHNLYRRLD